MELKFCCVCDAPKGCVLRPLTWPQGALCFIDDGRWSSRGPCFVHRLHKVCGSFQHTAFMPRLQSTNLPNSSPSASSHQATISPQFPFPCQQLHPPHRFPTTQCNTAAARSTRWPSRTVILLLRGCRKSEEGVPCRPLSQGFRHRMLVPRCGVWPCAQLSFLVGPL